MQQPDPPAAAPAAGLPRSGPGGAFGSSVSLGEGHPVYVSYEEKKVPSDRKPPRKSSGHTYVVKFFLVDTHGTEYLAAVGEDQGDAHYLYENQSPMPFLRANNKGEVRTWLEGIIERSKERAGVHSHLVTDVVPHDPNQIHLPKFVGHAQEKHDLPDGRHRIEWYLMDQNNDAHLAVVGEEKETRDGHYLYRTQGIFDTSRPLHVGNQREVERWLDAMVVHGGMAPVGPSGKAPAADSAGAAPTTSGRAHSMLLSETSGHRGASSRAGQAARPGGGGGGGGSQKKAAGQKHDLLKQATSNVKKFKTQQAGRLGADPDQEVRDVVAAELQRWAQEEAQRREAIKRQALAYATDPLVGKEASAAKRCLAALKLAAQQPSSLPPAGSTGSHQQQLNLVDALAALRELAHMYTPLSLVSMPELKECLGKLQAHQHPEVKQLATGVLEQWLHTAVAQAEVLSDPRYVQDPRSVLESSLSSRTIMDPIVAAVTRRKLHPPPAAVQYYAGPRQGQQERAGSRLGGGAAAAAAGAAAGEDSQAAATPGGLSARPSEQSLQDLLGTGGPGAGAGAGAAGGSGAADSAGGGAMAGGSQGGLADQLYHQTVERRRLNLDALDSPAGPAAAGALTAAGLRRQQQLTVSSSGAEGDEEATAAGGGRGSRQGLDGEEEDPSSAPHSSSMLNSDSQRGGRAGGGAGGLNYTASVELINAPIDEMETEQAELLS